MKEVSEQQSAERKSFENKMKQEYKLKKERWKREMAEVDTPKRQREAVLSQHKENFKEMDATESQRMARNQKEILDREVRKFRRRRLVKYHELEQDLLREVILFSCFLCISSLYYYYYPIPLGIRLARENLIKVVMSDTMIVMIIIISLLHCRN